MTTIELPDQGAAREINSPNISEIGTRDREGVILAFLGTVLRSAFEDLSNAQGWIPKNTGGANAAQDAINSICIAEEYVEELVRLTRRPLAKDLASH